MTDKPDEIDELFNLYISPLLSKDTYDDVASYKAKLLALKSKWEAEAYKKGYIDGGINQLTTNGDK